MKKPSVLDGQVVVVGGGVTGMTSALLLQESGADVVLIEKQPLIGGLARSFEYDNFIFDVGPHRYHTENPNVVTFLERLMKNQSLWFPRCSEVFFRGKYYSWPLKPQNLLQLPLPLALRASLDLAVNSYRKYDTDSFETYVLRQYGPTLYQNFFADYSQKFLGIHPRDTHTDWAKVGINRAIIENDLQMQNLSQLLKTTLLQSGGDEAQFLYPKKGIHQTWQIAARLFEQKGGRLVMGSGARLEAGKGRVSRVVAEATGESFDPSVVIWTAPITLATRQLDLPTPDLRYLGLLLYNVCAECDVPRNYQWCYYGAKHLVFNRISIPKFFSPTTSPPGTTGLCVELTCMEGDERWHHAERLTDWVVDDLVRVGMIPNRKAVSDVYVERIPDSYPIYHKEYPEELQKARNALSTFDNFHLAGRTGMFWYNNMDHSIENAMQLCKRLLRDAGRVEAEEQLLAAGGL